MSKQGLSQEENRFVTQIPVQFTILKNEEHFLKSYRKDISQNPPPTPIIKTQQTRTRVELVQLTKGIFEKNLQLASYFMAKDTLTKIAAKIKN